MAEVVDAAAEKAGRPADCGPPQGTTLTIADRIALLRWHLDRYDRLRSSTANRAAVVLSAGAILFAGNAVLLSQVLGGGSTTVLRKWELVVFTIGAMVSASLVVLSLLRASSVLVTPKDSRTMFAEQEPLPTSLIFNGTDTVREISSFADFRAVVTSEQEPDILQAATVELWIGIRQHRHRYVRLRGAVRLLRYAALAFLIVLVAAMVVNLAVRL